jgi:hypothetical protein
MHSSVAPLLRGVSNAATLSSLIRAGALKYASTVDCNVVLPVLRGFATAAAPAGKLGDRKPSADAAPSGSTNSATAPAPARSSKEAYPPVSVPAKGPFKVQAAWRRVPGDRSHVLMERSIHEQYKNLLKLVDHHMPPKPEAFHRILRSVKSAADLEIATKALHVCQDKKVLLNEHTASLWVSACLRAGAPATALSALKDAPRTRLFLNKSSAVALARYAAIQKDADLLKSTSALLSSSGLASKLRFHEAASFVHAYASVGDLDSALHLYGKLPTLASTSNRLTTSAYPTTGILSGSVNGPSAPSDAQVAKLRELVLPVAGGFPQLRPLIDQVSPFLALPAPFLPVLMQILLSPSLRCSLTPSLEAPVPHLLQQQPLLPPHLQLNIHILAVHFKLLQHWRPPGH